MCYHVPTWVTVVLLGLVSASTAQDGPKTKAAESRNLSNAEQSRVFESAKDFFDNGKKIDQSLDGVLSSNEDAVRQIAWKAYLASTRHQNLKADFDKNQVTHEKHLSPYTVKRVGRKPKAGWPIFIAMHGGGGVPKAVNDAGWATMKQYYRDQPTVEGYLYVALRAPNDVWNGFYDHYMCPLTIHLIRQFVLFAEADPNKVFIMGYSHGGYGAFYIGPKIPDRFAAIHASAAAESPGTISAKNLRNTRFTFMIGENDTAHNRRAICERFAKVVETLRSDNPGDYPVAMEFKKGYGHGGLPDRDKIKDMYAHRRNPVPKHLTWEPTDGFIKDFFWLSIEERPRRGQWIDAKVDGAKIVVQTKNVESFTLWLDQRLVNRDAPINLVVNGKPLQAKLTPTFATLCESILRRGDPGLAGSCEIHVAVQAAENPPGKLEK